MNEAIDRAIKVFGSQAAMASALDVKQPTISEWLRGERQVPAERCPQIERATSGAVRCEDLRPDVEWDVLRDQPAATPTPPNAPTPPAPAAAREEPAPAAAGKQEHADTPHRRGADSNGDPYKKRNTEQADLLAQALGEQHRKSDKPSKPRGGGRDRNTDKRASERAS